MTKNEYWYWLCNIDKLSPIKIKALLEYFETPEEMFKAKAKEIEGISNLRQEEKEALINNKDINLIKSGYERIIKNNIKFVTIEDEEYPQKLKNMEDSPMAIYIKGHLPEENLPSIAIVGARNCSEYGREVTKYISSELSRQGIQVISGLARGIDSYAHIGALNTGSSTYGVLGCGINMYYPLENINLYYEVEKDGGIISEYNMDTPPFRHNFPMRNRIISGLSDKVLVIEAKAKSGSLITADLALEQGKDIYCIPGKINDELSKGTNNLIRMGAKLVLEPEDILEDYNLENNKNKKIYKKNNFLLDNTEKIVYANLSLEPKHIEQLVNDTGLAVNEITEILINLELKDCIKQSCKNYYIVAI